MQNKFTRDRFTWLIYLFLAIYGYFINVIGPVTPFLKAELGLSYTISSLHYTVFAVGILFVGLGGNLVIARLGRWRALWLGAAGLSLGSLLLIAGRTPVLTIGATFFMGLVGSLILVIVPSALADRHGEMRAVALSEANVISSLASTAAPLLVGTFSSTVGGWRMGLGIAALAPFIIYFFFRDIKPGGAVSTSVNGSHLKQPLPVLYWIYWISIVLAVAVEFCMISWSADYLETTLGMPRANAAQAVSLFLLAMIIGRLAGSRLVQRISAQWLVSASVLTAIAGFMLYWQAANIPSALVGLFLTGLGVASLYPLTLSLAIGAAGNDTVQASTRATLASGTAILTLPLVLGRLADAAGIHQAYGIVLVLLICVLGIILAVQTLRRKQLL
jgi:fucose permease